MSSGERGPLRLHWSGGCVAAEEAKVEVLLSPTPPNHHTELKLMPIYGELPKLPLKRHPRGGGGNNIRENMCNAKNNHRVMRRQNWAASGAGAGIFRKEGAEIPLAVSSDILGEKI